MRQHFELIGTGLYFPQVRLTAEDADQRAGLPAGWTRDHIGVLTRYECAPPETLGSMAVAAIEQALSGANVGWNDIDLILDGSTCRHQPIPCNAAYLQHCIGPAAAGIPCLDVQSTCLGFVVALNVANALFAAETYRQILIVCSEAALTGVNWHDPESACLMGDGAAAAVVRRCDPQPGYGFALQTFAQYLEACQIRGGGLLLPPTVFTPEKKTDYLFSMDGPRLVQAAGKHLPPMVEALLQQAQVQRDDLQVIPHQAAPRALALVRRLLRFRAERFHQHVADYGNLIAASIPSVLHLSRAEGVVKPGDRVLLLGTSAGYSQAGLVFRV